MAVGLIAPMLRSVLFGMPTMYPTAIAMTFELAVYGALTGILYKLLPRRTWSIYVALILAMIGGRIVWGAAQYALLLARGTAFTLELFLAGAVINAIPGIILHIVLIPLLVIVLEKAKLTMNNP